MLRWWVALLVCTLLGACAPDPPPLAKSASEYLATIHREPSVAGIRIFVGPPILKNGTWSDEEEPRIIRAAVADSLGAMGFAIVKLDNEADAVARFRLIRQLETQTSTYELEFMRDGLEVDNFPLEDTTLSYAGAAREDRMKRAYTRMLAARAPSITRSPKLAALAQQRGTAPVSSSARTTPKIETGAPSAPTPPVGVERDKAIAWMQSASKAASSTAVATFTQQLDGVIGSGQDGQWQLGWGMTKDGMARVARWRAGSFEARSITPVEATQLGIAETGNTFTTHVRGSLAPLGPSSTAPPPPAPPPPPPPLPPNTETGKGRDAAVAWLRAHAKAAQTASSLIEQLDEIIRTGTRGEWKIGWGLTESFRAYFFAYSADGAFQATELSVADAQSQGYKAYAVTFSKIER